MNRLPAIKAWLFGRNEEPEDVLASLLLAAQEDTGLRDRILFLLRAPAHQRESLVNTALHEMKLRGESAEACAAFAILATEKGAKAALRILNAP